MKKAIIVYWTGTGNTEIMADQIKLGLESQGYEVVSKEVYEVDIEDVLLYDKILLGCPSMGFEELEEEEFEPFFQQLEHNIEGKNIALFGSYGWGDGEWMEDWEERIYDANANLFEDKGLIINSTPSTEEEEECFSFGERFAKL